MGLYDAVFKVCSCSAEGQVEIAHGTGLTAFIAAIPTGRRINISLDQSTAQIGVCVSDADTDELYGIADICNLGFPSAFEFKQSFLDWTRNNFRTSLIDIFFYEIPVEHGRDMHVRKVLNALRSFISEFPNYITSLQDANMLEINNVTWKSHFLADDIYHGVRSKTADVKVSAMQETMRRFPQLSVYCQAFPKPPDSCDAVGIMYGGLEEIRSTFDRNIQKINRTMVQPTGAKYNLTYFSTSLAELDTKIAQHKDFSDEHYGHELVEFNPSMSIQENCTRWVAGHNKVAYCIVTDKKSRQIVRWESNLEAENTDFYFLRIVRSNPVFGLK